MRRNLLIILCLSLSGCSDIVDPVDLEGLASLQILPQQDTLYLSNESDPYSLELNGSFVEELENYIAMSGVTERAEYTFFTYDTTFRTIPTNQVQWHSTSVNVATVINGVIYPDSEGTTLVHAEVNGIRSAALAVKVNEVLYAPDLRLDAPLTQIVFADRGNISGFIEDKALLELNGGSYSYTREGRFAHIIYGFTEGINTVEAKAINAKDASLFSSQYKTFYYYPLGSDPDNPGNTIIGSWDGLLNNELPFSFEVTQSEIQGRFDISGVIDLAFNDLIYVEDVVIRGIIDDQGFIKTSLDKTEEGFVISGELEGFFSTLGEAKGSFSSELAKPGFPKFAIPGVWTATKSD